MCREELDGPSGITRSCTLGLRSSEPQMRSSTTPRRSASLSMYCSKGISSSSKLIARTRRSSSELSPIGPGRGKHAKIDYGVSLTGHALV